jgi:cell division inhibitor SulA
MSSLEKLKSSRVIWTANDQHHAKQAALAFDQPELDNALQGGISPYGLLMFRAHTGSGELSFLRPIIQSAAKEQQYIALINPPGLPNTDWFKQNLCDDEHLFFINSADNDENLWAFEQCLMSGVCGAVIAWDLEANAQQLRRCHLRASQHRCQAIWFNSPKTTTGFPHSPCNAQLHLYQQNKQWYVDVLKQHGGWPQAEVRVTHPMPLSNYAINQTLRNTTLSAAINT